ncbi:MAG TPA: hypothetical protein VFL17_24065 [Anaerolineae bacterium]|nr:hypothetical protein [Anaerolineae bacterium]
MKMGPFALLILTGTLLLAAVLRLNHLEWAEFKLDEANLSRLSLNLARGVEIPLVGIGASTGIPNLPLAAWLMAIPYAVSSSPIVATGFVALLNVVAVAGCFALAKKWLSAYGQPESGHAAGIWTAAFLATLLFAVAPWAVIHSRKIWAQNLLPPLALVWAWAGWLAFVRRRPRALIGHWLALAACIHVHYSGLWLLPVTLAWMIVFARRLKWRSALAAVALFAATFAPFVVADALNGAPNLNRLLLVAQGAPVVDGEALRLAWLMVTGQEIHSLAGPQEFTNYLASVPGGETGFALVAGIGVLVVAGAAIALVDVIRATRRRSLDEPAAAAFMMLTWLALPVLLQTSHSLPIFIHYFIVLNPAPYLLMGTVYVRLAESLHDASRASSRGGRHVASVVRWGFIALVVLVASLQALQTIALQQFVAGRATPGGFGTPVGTLAQIAADATAVSQGLNGSEVLIYAEGDDPRTHEAPAVFDVLLPPDVPRRFIDLTRATEVYPRDAAAVVIYSPQGLTVPGEAVRRTPLRRETSVVPLRRGDASARVGEWPGQTDGAWPCGGQRALGHWANGVALLSVDRSGAWRGPGGWIELCFRVDREPEQADYHWFTHLIGPGGQRYAQVDAPALPSAFWRPGDTVIARFGPYILPENAPAGLYVMRVGMYTYPNIVNVPRDDGGQPADYVEVNLDNSLD